MAISMPPAASTKPAELHAVDAGPGITLSALPRGVVINWSVVLVELKAHGWSLARIGRVIDQPPSNLQYWKQAGGRVPFEDALPLIDLWSDVTGKPADALPRRTKSKKKVTQE